MVAFDKCSKTDLLPKTSPSRWRGTVPALESELWMPVTFVKCVYFMV